MAQIRVAHSYQHIITLHRGLIAKMTEFRRNFLAGRLELVANIGKLFEICPKSGAGRRYSFPTGLLNEERCLWVLFVFAILVDSD